MNKRNDGKGPDNVAQNRFTAYLLVAMRNTRRMYLEKRKAILQHELPLDQIWDNNALIYEPDMLDFLSPLDQLEDPKLQALLNRASERDLHILVSRIVEDKSLREICQDLNTGFNTVSSAYHRLIRRLRRELE